MGKKGLISIDDITKNDILDILENVDNSQKKDMSGKILATLFFEPSTRTRMSFESAFIRMGGQVIGFTNPDVTSFKKGETLHDAAKMIQNYCDVVAMRHPSNGAVCEFARHCSKPVINAGDGSGEHPTQALIDLYTILKAQGKIEGLHIAMVGDLKFGRTVHSLTKLLACFDVDVTFVAPEILRMPEKIAKLVPEATSTDKLTDVIDSADIIYMTRVQEERFDDKAEYEKLKDHFVLTKSMLINAKSNMRILHPLPRVNEIAKDVDETVHAHYFEQAANAVRVRQAIIEKILINYL